MTNKPVSKTDSVIRVLSKRLNKKLNKAKVNGKTSISKKSLNEMCEIYVNALTNNIHNLKYPAKAFALGNRLKELEATPDMIHKLEKIIAQLSALHENDITNMSRPSLTRAAKEAAIRESFAAEKAEARLKFSGDSQGHGGHGKSPGGHGHR